MKKDEHEPGRIGDFSRYIPKEFGKLEGLGNIICNLLAYFVYNPEDKYPPHKEKCEEFAKLSPGLIVGLTSYQEQINAVNFIRKLKGGTATEQDAIQHYQLALAQLQLLHEVIKKDKRFNGSVKRFSIWWIED